MMNNKLLKIAVLFIVFNIQHTISNPEYSGLKAQSVGINATGASPDTSAALDIDITTGGLLIPRLTTTQRDNIVSPALSLMVFNITDSCLQIYSGVNWENIYCLGDTVCITPSTPGAITGNDTVCSGTAGEPYSIAAVSGAASYNWTVPSGATVASGQGTTSITVDFGSISGNVCVTATNNCGTSPLSCQSVTIGTTSTTMSWTDPVTGTCNGLIYQTIQNIVNAMPVCPINVRITANQVAPLPDYGFWMSTFLNTTCVREWLQAWANQDVINFDNWNPAVCQATDTTGTDYFFVCKNAGGGNLQIAIYPVAASPTQYMKVYILDRTSAWCDLAGVNNRPGFDIQTTNSNTKGVSGDELTFTWW